MQFGKFYFQCLLFCFKLQVVLGNHDLHRHEISIISISRPQFLNGEFSVAIGIVFGHLYPIIYIVTVFWDAIRRRPVTIAHTGNLILHE